MRAVLDVNVLIALMDEYGRARRSGKAILVASRFERSAALKHAKEGHVGRRSGKLGVFLKRHALRPAARVLEARIELHRLAGIQFCEICVAALERALGNGTFSKEPVGSGNGAQAAS